MDPSATVRIALETASVARDTFAAKMATRVRLDEHRRAIVEHGFGRGVGRHGV